MEVRSRVLLRCLVLVVMPLAVATGCSGSEPEASTESTTSTTTTEKPTDEAEAVRVVESLAAGDSAGFDPGSWAAAADQAAVLPAGATVETVDDSVVVSGDQATVDVVISAPGSPPSRNWVFLHKVDGEWLVYGSLPLEMES